MSRRSALRGERSSAVEGRGLFSRCRWSCRTTDARTNTGPSLAGPFFCLRGEAMSSSFEVERCAVPIRVEGAGSRRRRPRPAIQSSTSCRSKSFSGLLAWNTAVTESSTKGWPQTWWEKAFLCVFCQPLRGSASRRTPRRTLPSLTISRSRWAHSPARSSALPSSSRLCGAGCGVAKNEMARSAARRSTSPPARSASSFLATGTSSRTEMHRAVAPSSGNPTDRRRSECHSGSHQPRKLRTRCSRDSREVCQRGQAGLPEIPQQTHRQPLQGL